jgi:iron(III) transport system ATP-binding protein
MRVAVKLGDSEIVVTGTAVADGETDIAVRPETVTIDPAPGSAGSLPGRVVKATYVGTHMEYTVETAAGVLFAICPRVDRPLAAGHAVALSLAPRGILVVGG